MHYEILDSWILDGSVLHTQVYFFVQPVGIPDDPEGELLGFHITVPYARDYKKVKMLSTAKKALDWALDG